jgi:hypothetical protein
MDLPDFNIDDELNMEEEIFQEGYFDEHEMSTTFEEEELEHDETGSVNVTKSNEKLNTESHSRLIYIYIYILFYFYN